MDSEKSGLNNKDMEYLDKIIDKLLSVKKYIFIFINLLLI